MRGPCIDAGTRHLGAPQDQALLPALGLASLLSRGPARAELHGLSSKPVLPQSWGRPASPSRHTEAACGPGTATAPRCLGARPQDSPWVPRSERLRHAGFRPGPRPRGPVPAARLVHCAPAHWGPHSPWPRAGLASRLRVSGSRLPTFGAPRAAVPGRPAPEGQWAHGAGVGPSQC